MHCKTPGDGLADTAVSSWNEGYLVGKIKKTG